MIRNLFFILGFLALSAQAQVFTLWPSSGGANASANPLEAEEFNVETVIINGVKLEMRMGLIYSGLHDLALALREHFKDAQIAAAGNNLIVVRPAGEGWQQRYLYIALRHGMPVLQIAMKVPEKLPKSFDWPRQLPLPSGAEPFRVMSFPKRGALYGAFRHDFTSTAEALEQVIAIATPGGWVPMAHEEANQGRASGEILIRKNPSGVMLVNFTREGTGFVYFRPLDKK